MFLLYSQYQCIVLLDVVRKIILIVWNKLHLSMYDNVYSLVLFDMLLGSWFWFLKFKLNLSMNDNFNSCCLPSFYSTNSWSFAVVSVQQDHNPVIISQLHFPHVLFLLISFQSIIRIILCKWVAVKSLHWCFYLEKIQSGRIFISFLIVFEISVDHYKIFPCLCISIDVFSSGSSFKAFISHTITLCCKFQLMMHIVLCPGANDLPSHWAGSSCCFSTAHWFIISFHYGLHLPFFCF